jgi:hypothetical protein
MPNLEPADRRWLEVAVKIVLDWRVVDPKADLLHDRRFDWLVH